MQKIGREEGTELIDAIREIKHRKKAIYVLNFENISNVYVSNYWLEKELKSRNIDLNYKILVKIDKLKAMLTKTWNSWYFVSSSINFYYAIKKNCIFYTMWISQCNPGYPLFFPIIIP